MKTDNKKGYHSTTPDPTVPQTPVNTPTENPDKTKKRESNDPTKGPDIDITSQPNKKKLEEDDFKTNVEEEDKPQRIEEEENEPYKRTKK